MTRYVVCVKPPDDHPGAVRVYGPWRDRKTAEGFMESVRKAVNKVADHLDETTGYAYLMDLRGPRTNEAKRYATTGSIE